MKIKVFSFWTVVVTGTLLLAYSQSAAQGSDPVSATSKTVVGQRNPPLYDGARAMLSADYETGVALTLQGLEVALGSRELKMAHSNLCAGYLMLDQFETALKHCNEVIELDRFYWRAYNNRALVYMEMGRYEESEADIARGQELQPRSKTLKIAKGMLLDETDPVTERVEIDERRSAMDDLEDRNARARN
jgi:tetratricopeptide (TPR) repeat protein